MKKVVYSIVMALILSVILILLIPIWIFKGDARWTYQNDAARVDVSFKGHLKNGHVGAEGAGLSVSQPAWLSSGGYQGTKVEFPVSYRDKTYQIKLTPKADEWGKDASLIIELKGRDFQHRGKRRAAWVCFQNITLNGQPVAAEKVVWHNKPFVLRYPLPSSPEITLAFDVRKPLAASDISFVNPLVFLSAFFLICLFFTPLRRVGNHLVTFIDRRDVLKVISDGYRHIDPIYRRSFWIIFGVLCFAFGFHTICFMWGSHDWSLLDSTHRWREHAWEGRYMLFSIKALLSSGIYLPLIHDVITFFILALNAILLCKYWCLEKRVIYYVFCGLVLTVQPFTLSMVYYVNMTPEVFIGVTCALVALILSEKVSLGGESLPRKIIYSLIAIVLINFTLAMYAVLLNTIAVAFVGKMLVQSFDWDGARQKWRSLLRTCIISATNVILGIVLYKLIITFVFPLRSSYNTDILPMERLPERLSVLFKQCFHQLYEYRMPFLPQWTLWIILGFTIILTLYICVTGTLVRKAVRFVLLFASLFATQTAMIIAGTHLVAPRVELFGFVFFEVLVITVVFTRLSTLHNVSVTACACIIFASVLHDLDCLRVWKLGFDAEKMLWNRVLARLEIQRTFDPTRKYDFVLIGQPIAMRPRYYTESQRFNTYPYTLLTDPYHRGSGVFVPYESYYPTRILSRGFCSFHKGRPDYVARLKRLYQAGVLQKAEVWPKPNGLIVWKDMILFVTDGKELDNYRKKFGRELGKK